MYEDLLKDPPDTEEDIPDILQPPGPAVPVAGLCFAERL
jgi:hypothetical protein